MKGQLPKSDLGGIIHELEVKVSCSAHTWNAHKLTALTGVSEGRLDE